LRFSIGLWDVLGIVPCLLFGKIASFHTISLQYPQVLPFYLSTLGDRQVSSLILRDHFHDKQGENYVVSFDTSKGFSKGKEEKSTCLTLQV
jgi:hypothetical protein